MAKKFLDNNGLLYFWQKIKEKLAGKVDTTAYNGKINTIETDINTLFDEKAEQDDLTTLNTTVEGLKTSKQDNISAGDGIIISGNKISAKTPDLIKKVISPSDDSIFKSIEYDSSTGKYVLRNYDAKAASPVDTKKAIATVDDIEAAQITVDNALSATSENPVQNKVINTALGNKVNTSTYNTDKQTLETNIGKKVDKVTGKQLSTNDFTNDLKTKLDALPTNATLSSTYAKKSDITSLYKPGGNKTFAQLSALTLADVEVGTVYNITDDFTTNDNFLEGAGIDYKAGTNVVCVLDGSAHKWDALGGMDMEEITNTEIDTILAS